MNALTPTKRLLEVYRNLGYKPFAELFEKDRAALSLMVKTENTRVIYCWWRKLENGQWDWVGPFEKE